MFTLETETKTTESLSCVVIGCKSKSHCRNQTDRQIAVFFSPDDF